MVIDMHNYKFWREVCSLETQKQHLQTAIDDMRAAEAYAAQQAPAHIRTRPAFSLVDD
ncbi:hypothetical protein H1O16_gp045 [Burkholderia phage BcepSaruman]|uniref:Uncharacterized protein n=1 Tax=Burkholderia phage BcepSaruman TaxID=2530032 RepID=A0A4D5ZHC9_9CAUD|nr:hypothetical protein H1O16_gp045 [Burkholderia phage BcepSaruman]QBX06458.1 hypothetical protein BcepSaruman_045 [Burkholderia phage BcepSaruman]